MRGDLQVLGPQATLPRRVAASATRFEAGEPLYSTATLSSGAISSNTWVLAAGDLIAVGTNIFGGVAIKGALPFKTGTLVAQKTYTANPVPWLGLIRGRAETVANVDTDAEILAITGDVVTIDYNATGASDGGELYTIKDTAAADTSGFQIIDGNPSKQSLDVVCYGTIYRHDVS